MPRIITKIRLNKEFLTTKLTLVIIGLTAGSALLIPATYASFHPVTSSEIADNTIQSRDISNTAGVASADIRDGQVSSVDIGTGQVASVDIRDGQVGSVDIGTGQVASVDILDGTITSQDIASGTIPSGSTPADNSVTSAKIVDGEVKSVDIGDGEVFSLDIVDGQVGSADIGDGQVTSAEIANDVVTTEKISDTNGVHSLDIVDGQVGSADIGDGQVTVRDIADDAIQPNIQRIISPNTGVSPGATITITANCPAGTIVSGGGFWTHTSLMRIFQNWPFDQDTWQVTGHNTHTSSVNFQAFALCAGPMP